MTDTPTAPASSPLVIGATGGSGTRVVARIARRAGYELGTNLNSAEDAMEFVPFHNRWINRVIAADERPFSVKETEQMTSDFREALGRHLPRHGEPGQLWGWKAPRSIYFLTFFHRLFPELKFIHVLRDGRDMAFSKNQNQLRQHGRAILGWTERLLAPRAVRSILLWERINLRAAEYGAGTLQGNYLAVRFEDLCNTPRETVQRILAFLGAPLDAEEIAAAEVKPPTSLGRWSAEPPRLVQRLERSAARSLAQFGYLQK
jgi:hypothetical protein